jgi:hypothetical protein
VTEEAREVRVVGTNGQVGIYQQGRYLATCSDRVTAERIVVALAALDAKRQHANVLTDSEVLGDSEAAYRAFLLEFRKYTGRPMTNLEEALSHVAYSTGFLTGVDWAYRDVEANMPDETETR